MIRCVTTGPNSPAPWQPLSRSASPVGSGPDSTCDGLARALGMQENAPHSRVPAVPMSTGFRCHANTQIPAHQRDQLERLIRYTGRGAVSLERLTEDANGNL